MRKILCLILITINLSCGEDNTITGYVFDNENTPLSHVKVLVTGTDILTITDKDGFFSITTNSKSKELLFDKAGYKLKFQQIENLNILDLVIHLEEK